MTPRSLQVAAFDLTHRIRLAPRLWTASSRSLPDFLIVGAGRCGTTSLYHMLARHPQVMRSLHKEVHYFSQHYERGEDWYRAHLPVEQRKKEANAVTGEASPSYLRRVNVIERIKSLVPDCRFIVLLRNPVQQLYSTYHHLVRLGAFSGSFEENLRRCDEHSAAVRDSDAKGAWSFKPLEARAYHIAIENWFARFPRDQLLILEYQESFSDVRTMMEKVCSHVGISPWAPKGEERRNGGSYSPMDPAVRAALQKRAGPANEKLYRLLGRTFPWD